MQADGIPSWLAGDAHIRSSRHALIDCRRRRRIGTSLQATHPHRRCPSLRTLGLEHNRLGEEAIAITDRLTNLTVLRIGANRPADYQIYDKQSMLLLEGQSLHRRHDGYGVHRASHDGGLRSSPAVATRPNRRNRRHQIGTLRPRSRSAFFTRMGRRPRALASSRATCASQWRRMETTPSGGNARTRTH